MRVINDDQIGPGGGFEMHPHRDMEIITYLLSGALEHRDSLGNGSVIRAGDVQRMTAGTGILHSEFNASQSESVHLLQIWLFPATKRLPPSYEQKNFADSEKQGRLRLVASVDGREGSLTMHQDADLFAVLLGPGERVTHNLPSGRHAWVQVALGGAVLNGHVVQAGDGAAVSDEEHLEIAADRSAEVLLFDLG